MTDAERQYWIELRRAATIEEKAITRYLAGEADGAKLNIELRRAEGIWRAATAAYEETQMPQSK